MVAADGDGRCCIASSGGGGGGRGGGGGGGCGGGGGGGRGGRGRIWCDCGYGCLGAVDVGRVISVNVFKRVFRAALISPEALAEESCRLRDAASHQLRTFTDTFDGRADDLSWYGKRALECRSALVLSSDILRSEQHSQPHDTALAIQGQLHLLLRKRL